MGFDERRGLQRGVERGYWRGTGIRNKEMDVFR